jgi:hypothetical protein
MLWLLGALVVLLCVTAHARRSFRERFAPLTDAEFLARCPPGTDPAVALKVRRMVAERFGVEYERVQPSMTFIEDFGAD